MRKRTCRSSGRPFPLRHAALDVEGGFRCTSMALANSAGNPSPMVLKIRPSWRATASTINSCLCCWDAATPFSIRTPTLRREDRFIEESHFPFVHQDIQIFGLSGFTSFLRHSYLLSNSLED